MQLERAVLPPREQIAAERLTGPRRAPRSPPEMFRHNPEVDGAPVVGIDEALSSQLRLLERCRGRRARKSRGTVCARPFVAPATSMRALHHRATSAMRAVVGQRALDEGGEPLFISFVGTDPRGLDLGLARGLLHEGAHPSTQLHAALALLAVPAEGPPRRRAPDKMCTRRGAKGAYQRRLRPPVFCGNSILRDQRATVCRHSAGISEKDGDARRRRPLRACCRAWTALTSTAASCCRCARGLGRGTSRSTYRSAPGRRPPR